MFFAEIVAKLPCPDSWAQHNSKMPEQKRQKYLKPMLSLTEEGEVPQSVAITLNLKGEIVALLKGDVQPTKPR